MNDMRLEFLKKLVSYFVFFLLIVKSCYKINKIEQCKDVKRKINYVSEILPVRRYQKYNTLVPHNAPADERAKKLFKRLDAMGMQYCFTSNNKEPRVKAFCEAVGGKYYVYKANKPSIKGYETAMKLMGTDKKNTFFVGDQLFTDVYGANRTGIHSILVTPMNPKEEIQIVIKRYFEKIVLWQYRKKKH